jgi:carboxymethylenebutenolidase
MHDFENDLTSLSTKRDFSRRQMLATSLAVVANGLTAGEVKIPVADGEIPAYHAMPAKGGPFPLILVVQEIFGVHEHINDICRRLAKEGHMAIAAELYARQGSVAGMTDIQDLIKVVSKVPDAEVMSDLDAVVAYAKASGLPTRHALASRGSAGAAASLGSMPSTSQASKRVWLGTASSSAILHRKHPSIR